jgi:hypothetical protein
VFEHVHQNCGWRPHPATYDARSTATRLQLPIVAMRPGAWMLRRLLVAKPVSNCMSTMVISIDRSFASGSRASCSTSARRSLDRASECGGAFAECPDVEYLSAYGVIKICAWPRHLWEHGVHVAYVTEHERSFDFLGDPPQEHLGAQRTASPTPQTRHRRSSTLSSPWASTTAGVAGEFRTGCWSGTQTMLRTMTRCARLGKPAGLPWSPLAAS